MKSTSTLFNRITQHLELRLVILLAMTSISLNAQDTTGYLTTSVNSICLGDSALLSAGTVGANYGNGADGSISVSSGTIYTDAVRTSVTGNNASNSNSINVSSSSGFSVGDEIMVITMVDAATSNNTVGLHDFNIISGISGNTLTLTAVLINSYNAASSRKHQVLKVPNYTSVTISSGATLTCHSWDGTSGGILCFRANGTVSNSGLITAAEKGYRGVGHASSISGNQHYRNKNGAQGEGIYGTGYQGGNSNGSNNATWNSANGNGGGGGTGKQDSGGGGGGAYAANGSAGLNSGGHYGGTGGSAVGVADLSKLIMGGAGGEGGADEDGHISGAGANGGGVILISCANLNNGGTISANGQNGGHATNSNSNGANGSGSGMGGGGGGAGGSVKLISLFSGSGTITSIGGIKGNNNGGGGHGGAGSVGRIALASTSSSFPTTTPTSNTASLTVITGSSYLWNTGDTTSSIAVAPNSTTTYFVTITNGSWADTLSQEIYVFGTPNLPQIDDQEHCSGTFTFSATTDSLVETVWYDVATGGTPIHYGNQFTTPVLNDTTTYYVSSRYIPYTPPADEVDNAIQLALGLRLLDSDYQGNAVLLRKSAAANDTASFSFDSFGQLDLDSINAWAGSSSTLWVHTVYDQSGNGRNLIQTNTSRQPMLLLSGENGKPVLRFTTGKYLRYTTNDIVYPMSIVTSAKLTSNSCGRVFGASNNYIFAFYANNVNWHHFGTWISNSSINKVSASSSDTWIHTTMSASNTSHRFFDNGDEWPANTINSANSQPPHGFQLNGFSGPYETSNVDIMEVFIFNDTISDVEREYIEGRIASQYNWQTAGGQVVDASAGCLLSNPNRDTVAAFVTEPSFGLSNDTVSVNCGQDSVLIDAGAGWNSYAWSNQDTTQVCKAKYSGEYTIVVNDGLCTLSDTVFVSIPNPELEDFTMCNGDTISAGYSSLGGYASGGTLGAVGTEALNIFLADGTLVLPSSTSVRAILVGGGGGGGMDMGGGGGGGGFIDTTFVLPAGSYNITVGQGGTGAPAAGTFGQPGGHQYSIPALNGGNSSIGSLLAAIGGGAGGTSYWNSTPGAAGSNGGSGGGCSGYNAPNGSGAGLGTAGQGNRGGHGAGSYRSGGGGGAGSQGGGGPNGGSYNANGGVGLQSDILGTTYYFAGGGGGSGYSTVGGNGGIGGGGGGAVGTTTGGTGLNNGSPGGGGNIGSQTNKPGGNAGANTGGGGGGGSHFNSNNKGGEGGSGIVVLRYTPIVSYQFLWSTGDTSATIDVSPSQTTDYYVTISDGVSTCYDTMTVFVNAPAYTFSNDTITNCGADTVSVDAGSGWLKYEWSNGDTSQIASISQRGIYYLTVTNQYDCSVSDSVSIGLINPSLVQGDTTFCVGDSALIGFGAGAIGGMTEAGFKLALGLRLINTDYSGEAVQLRRSSDNALSDFGFLNGELDVAAISSWAGTSTIYVRTLYDQSGSSRNVVQTTNNRQPTLVLNSAYGAPIIHFTTSQQLRYTVNYTFQQPFTLVTAAKTTGSSNGRVFGSYHQNWLHGFWQNRINVAHYEGWRVYPGITSSSGWQVPYIHTMWKADQTNWNFYSNATVQPKYSSNTINAGTDPRGFTLNGSNNLGELSNVDIMEVIMFDDTLAPAELENVQKSVANRFGIATAYGAASAGSIGGGSYEYLWSNGDTSNMINVSPNDTTTYYVTITDGFAECVDSITVNIVDPNFIFSNDTIFSCGADTVGVSAGSTWDNYLWSNGDTTETTSITSSGAYSLTVSNNGQCDTWDTIVVSVINSSVEQGDTTICIGDTATLAIESNGGSSGSTSFSYLWSNSDTTSSINVFPNDTATYFVTITDGFAECYDTITVNVNDPDYSFTNDTVLANCFADSVIVDAGSGWASYNWSAGDTTQTKAFSTTGTYNVTVTDNGGCTSSDSVIVSVISPILTQGDLMICLNDTAEIGFGSTGLSSDYALTLDGSGDYVLSPYDANFNVNNLTIEAWVYSGNIGSAGTVFEKGALNSQYSLFFTNSRLYFRTYHSSGTGSTQIVRLENQLGLTDNTWHHIAVTYDGSARVIYVDGSSVASDSRSGALNQNTNGHIIGAYNGASTGAHSRFFNGSIDELRVWNVARTATEISDSYNQLISPSSAGLIGYWPFEEGGGTTTENIISGSSSNVFAGNVAFTTQNAPITTGSGSVFDYLWSNSDTTASILISPTANSDYSVSISDGIGECFDTITVYIDTISPTVFPHSNVSVYLNSSGQATLSASIADSATSDNCLIDSIYLSNSSFQCADIGSNPTLLYALDNNGNLDSAEFVVSIIDSNAPVAIAQSVTLYLDAAGTANLTVSQVDNGSTDNCAIDTMTLSSYNFVCADTGVNTITLTVSDVSGNSATQSAQITVMDTAAPTVLTQNVTVFLDANGEGTVAANQVDSSSSDNCAIASMILSDSIFDCSDTTSANNIVLSVTDISGNSASSNAQITVLDTMSPIAIAQNLTLFLDANGQVIAQPSQVDNGSYDNCGIANLTLSDSVFNCADSGINNISLTVHDVSGNSSTATAQLLVLDTISPSVVTQNIIAYLDSSGQVIISGLDLDSASTDNCAIASRILSDSIFDCSDTGSINIVTLTVTDSSGNSSSNDAEVIIVDSLAPAVITQNVTVYLDTNGEASITVNQIDNGSSDNCAIDTMYLSNDSFDCNSFGLDTIILFVIDASGNVSQDIAIVNVLETTIPTALAQNVTIYIDSAGYASISPLAADSGSYDNCAIETFALSDTTFACADVGENAVVFTVTDYSSNSSSMQITITVLDTIKPVIYAQNPTIYLDANGEASLTISQVDSGSYDNCSIASTLLSDSLFNCDQVGSNDIYFILSDVNGNIDSSIVSVNLLDTIKPTVLAENHQAYLNPDGEFSLDIDAVNASATDNCSVDSIYLEETDFACAHIGINYVSVFAIDENGNIGTISIELEILDTIPPIITYCPEDIVSCDSIIDYDTPTALDNCSNLNSLLTAGVESGVRFDIGLTEIQFSFSDTSGNSTTCDFSVKRISSPEITVSRDTTIFNGSAIGLTVQVDSAVDSYYWTPEDYLDDPSSNNPDASPIETTTYRVVVTTNDGCEMEDSVNIIVLNEVVVYNAFSPNNDGQNDYLEINGLDYYPDANVLIVNRAGAKVFESGGYSEPWDGRYKGEEMPVGPYFYFIDTGVSGAEILTGDISLIR